MIFTEKSELTILKLTVPRETVSFAELVPLLLERPSNVIYVEEYRDKEERLYGIITSGTIKRAKESGKNYVKINTHFTYIYDGEYSRAKQIFAERKTINAIPVLDKSGKLLGDYVRWNDLLFLEYSMDIVHHKFALNLLENTSIALVQPNMASSKKQRIFQEMESVLRAKESVFVEILEPSDIVEKYSKFAYVLLVDFNEVLGIATLCSCIFEKENLNLYTYLFLCSERIKPAIDSSTIYPIAERTLQHLTRKGIHVLSLSCQDNGSAYYKKFVQEIDGRFTQLKQAKTSYLIQEIRETFLEELFDAEYGKELANLPREPVITDGIVRLKDHNTSLFHVCNGERLTVGQPDTSKNCIYFYGPCIIEGSHVEDSHTIESWLQQRLNHEGYSVKVFNYGVWSSALSELLAIVETPLKTGDIIILYMNNWVFNDIPAINLVDIIEKNSAPPAWFVDSPLHCNFKATKLYADAVYEKLLPVFNQPAGDRSPVRENNSFVSDAYINRYFVGFDPSIYKVIGSIVMNCNPFTFGHRYLIEAALKKVDYLIIFVVEEDKSFFDFDERFAMVCEGTVDLQNVRVVPSGECILTQKTFPEYFIKVADEDIIVNAENDIIMFAEQIAPKLNITYRFVGEEPEDAVTNEYNSAMKKILPAHGIQVEEVARKKDGENVISASSVRQYLEMNRWNKIKDLVPESTLRILGKRPV